MDFAIIKLQENADRFLDMFDGGIILLVSLSVKYPSVDIPVEGQLPGITSEISNNQLPQFLLLTEFERDILSKQTEYDIARFLLYIAVIFDLLLRVDRT